jgi:hypothetical protein
MIFMCLFCSLECGFPRVTLLQKVCPLYTMVIKLLYEWCWESQVIKASSLLNLTFILTSPNWTLVLVLKTCGWELVINGKPLDVSAVEFLPGGWLCGLAATFFTAAAAV